MALSPGTRLGQYQVAAQIGVGGMGEVYQATDTKLKRQVAIKVLPASVAADAERLARFQREAEVLASLNHPNIAAIYGLEDADGTKALVMELVEGPTLADRIADGPIPVDEALPIAKQIAEALEAAHEQGIIHRDLKPANIKLRPDGTVKVLDFGLAKAMEPVGAMPPGQSQLPTITTPAMTQAGMILGTVAYMSPEQAKGHPVDKRSDIWAFGAVLFEMLCGRRAFEGEDVSDTMASVLKGDTNWSALPSSVPPMIVAVLRRCLARDRRERARDIGDVQLALAGAFDTAVPSSGGLASPGASRTTLGVLVATAVAAGALVAGVVAWSQWPAADVPRVTRLTIAPADGQTLRMSSTSVDMALSPDGTQAAFTVNDGDGGNPLVLRSLNSLATTVLASRGFAPFFSADGAWVGFSDIADGAIKRVPTSGGPAQEIARVDSGVLGATWAPDDTIILGTFDRSGLYRVSAAGGALEPLTALDESRAEVNHAWPERLPGRNAVLFSILRRDTVLQGDDAEIAVLDLTTGEHRILLSGGSFPKYVPTGHLLYSFAGTLRAVRFDAERLEVVGDPVSIVDRVVTKATGGANVALGGDGSLIYYAGSRTAGLALTPVSTLVWVDAEGHETDAGFDPRAYIYPRLAPDGRRVAVAVVDGPTDLWVGDVGRHTFTRLTRDVEEDVSPLWTPDGERIVFSKLGRGVFRLRADGAGIAEALNTDLTDLTLESSSPDGSRLLVVRRNRNDIGVFSVAGDQAIEWLLQTPQVQERRSSLSPDGAWMAYSSNESGQFEVYVRPFPDVQARRWQISTSGGTSPLWSRDGRSLFYQDGPAMTRVSVEAGPEPDFGTPETLFEWSYPELNQGRQYDVAADGRLLMLKERAGSEESAPQIVVVQNFFTELERLLPRP
jgi:serine/threonine-protein kinase